MLATTKVRFRAAAVVGLMMATSPLAGGVVRSEAAVDEDPQLSPADPDHFENSAFGFDPGEERRYELGPADALRGGEGATWRLRFEGFDRGEGVAGEGSRRLAVFYFSHRRTERDYGVFNLGDARTFSIEVDGKVWLNRAGFPVELEFEELHRVRGSANHTSGVRTIRYALQEDLYLHKLLVLGSRDYDFRIRIANHEHLDMESLAGLYLYVPSSMACYGGPGSLDCGEDDFAFANPGFLSFMFPELWRDEYGEREFLVFKPSGLGGRPLGLIDIRRLMQRERDTVGNLRRYFDQTNLRLEEKTGIELGGREVEAWRLDVGGPVRAAYVQEDGNVLQVDIDPDPFTRKDRWIRQVPASEY